MHPRPIDLADLVQRALPLVRQLVGENVTVRLSVHPRLPAVVADEGQIEEALLNLAANARDAMPAGGTITIDVAPVTLDDAFVASHPGTRAGTNVALGVSDTGTGMDDATKAHVFEPFFTTKAPGKGTGLGLASVYGIVKQADGYIEVETRLGVGSTFRMYFAAVDAPSRERARTEARDALGGDADVLLVEDDPAVLAFTERALRSAGYRVRSFADPTLALAAALEGSVAFDVLVTDVVMPGLTGPALARRLEHSRPGLPVLYISGHPADAKVSDAAAYLQKPFTAAELAGALSHAIARTSHASATRA